MSKASSSFYVFTNISSNIQLPKNTETHKNGEDETVINLWPPLMMNASVCIVHKDVVYLYFLMRKNVKSLQTQKENV